MQDGMLRSTSSRSAKTPSDSLRCLQDDPRTPQRRPPGPPRRTQSAPKTLPRRTTTPSGWYQLRPAAPKAAKKPSKLRFWTLRTSTLDHQDLDFGPFIRRFSILQTLSCILEYRTQIENRKINKMQLCYFSFWRGGGDAALLCIG